MADFAGLLQRTIATLPVNDAPARAQIYQRARATMQNVKNEALGDAQVRERQWQRQALEAAIAAVEKQHDAHGDRSLNSDWGRALQAEFLRVAPRECAVVLMTLQGNDERMRLAAELYGFIKSAGYRMKDEGAQLGTFKEDAMDVVMGPLGEDFVVIVGAKPQTGQ